MELLTSLRNHPFGVRADFAYSLVISFAVPAEQLQRLLPPPLSLDTFGDTAFLAIAMVKTRHLRPAALPRIFGQHLFLAGYRIFVRYRNREGKRLRGLYILRSLTDRHRMGLLGELFTQYRYATVDITERRRQDRLTVSSQAAGFHLNVDVAEDDPPLPPTSRFPSWREARRFAGPLPFTFSYLPRRRETVIVEGVRQNWRPRPVRLVDQHFPYPAAMGLDAQPASVFMVENIPYRWRAGVVEKYTP